MTVIGKLPNVCVNNDIKSSSVPFSPVTKGADVSLNDCVNSVVQTPGKAASGMAASIFATPATDSKVTAYQLPVLYLQKPDLI